MTEFERELIKILRRRAGSAILPCPGRHGHPCESEFEIEIWWERYLENSYRDGTLCHEIFRAIWQWLGEKLSEKDRDDWRQKA